MIHRNSKLKHFIRRFERLRDDLDLGDDRHEVHVSGPARDDMPVKMFLDSRSRGFPHVQTYVESVGMRGFSQPSAPEFDLCHDFAGSCILYLKKAGDVLIRNDHQMAVVIRIFVENREAMLVPAKDQIFFIDLFPADAAKNAAFFLLSQDIIEPPGSKSDLHVVLP